MQKPEAPHFVAFVARFDLLVPKAVVPLTLRVARGALIRRSCPPKLWLPVAVRSLRSLFLSGPARVFHITAKATNSAITGRSG